jgi:hypothetical protein
MFPKKRSAVFQFLLLLGFLEGATLEWGIIECAIKLSLPQ